MNDACIGQVSNSPTKANRTKERFQLMPTQEKLSLEFECGKKKKIITVLRNIESSVSSSLIHNIQYVIQNY